MRIHLAPTVGKCNVARVEHDQHHHIRICGDMAHLLSTFSMKFVRGVVRRVDHLYFVDFTPSTITTAL